MRQLPVLAISAAVHAALVVWMGTRSSKRPPAPGRTAPVVELIAPAPTITPVEVVFLDAAATRAVDELPAPVAPPPDVPARLAATTTATRPATRAGHGGDGATGARGDGNDGRARGDGTTGPPGKNRWFDMRKGRPVRLTFDVPTPRRDGRAHAPETYGPDVDSGQLSPSGGGTYRSDQGPFTARVAPDGSVALADKRNLNVRFALPGPKTLGKMIADWYLDPNKPVGTLPPEKLEKEVRVGGDPLTGRDSETLPDPSDSGTLPILAGGFDITDALMRNRGQDPYASKKLRFLDSTRDQRVQIGLRHRARQLDQVTLIMQRNLDTAWASLADPVALRAALFELWDECAETGSEDLVRAGGAARTLVIGFIRGKLPAGTALGYTPDELGRLNARRQSRAAFDPYGSPPR